MYIYIQWNAAASAAADHFSHVGLFATSWSVTHRLLCPRDSPGKNTGGVAMPSSRGSSRPRDWNWVSDSLPSEPPGKPKEPVKFRKPNHGERLVWRQRCLILFLFFSKFIYFNWSIITLHYCIGFAIHQHLRQSINLFQLKMMPKSWRIKNQSFFFSWNGLRLCLGCCQQCCPENRRASVLNYEFLWISGKRSWACQYRWKLCI